MHSCSFSTSRALAGLLVAIAASTLGSGVTLCAAQEADTTPTLEIIDHKELLLPEDAEPITVDEGALNNEAWEAPITPVQKTEPNPEANLAPTARTGPTEENPYLDRWEGAQAMIEALNYPTRYLSPYPFFRDVPLDHPAYAHIETLRLHSLMVANSQGFFRPNEPFRRLDAFYAMYRLLRPFTPSPEETARLLEPFADKDTFPPNTRPVLARLVQEGIIRIRKNGTPMLRIDEPIKASYLTKIVKRAQLKMFDYQLVNEPGTVNNSHRPLPEGLKLVLTPTQALFDSQIQVGNKLYFALVKDITLPTGTILPQGSRVTGTVKTAEPAANQYEVQFSRLITPDDEILYDTLATMPFQLRSQKDSPYKEPFIVTGDEFSTTTEPWVDPTVDPKTGKKKPPTTDTAVKFYYDDEDAAQP